MLGGVKGRGWSSVVPPRLLGAGCLQGLWSGITFSHPFLHRPTAFPLPFLDLFAAFPRPSTAFPLQFCDCLLLFGDLPLPVSLPPPPFSLAPPGRNIDPAELQAALDLRKPMAHL